MQHITILNSGALIYRLWRYRRTELQFLNIYEFFFICMQAPFVFLSSDYGLVRV